MSDELEETRGFWDGVAGDWKIQVGDDGDENRRLNSDPVLWNFAGQVCGLEVIDAGCGTGYLSRKLHDRGARVTGVDFSESMIAIARASHPGIEFRVDSCTELATVESARYDLLVSNYVLMDVPDLEATVRAFHRVLKTGGIAVLVFSHPCFPQGRATNAEDGATVTYTWNSSYFEKRKCVDPPWGHFQSDFIWFHRPLSQYWKVFKATGFEVVDFEEPVVSLAGDHVAMSDKRWKHYQNHPCSVAFKLQKSIHKC